MKIAIAGGTGFLGSALSERLIELGHEVFILTRKKPAGGEVKFVQWLADGSAPEKELAGIDAFINLAGESLNSGRWTAEQKQRLLESRLTAAKETARIISVLPKKPSVLIAASAVGYYGTSLDASFTEADGPGRDFLAGLVSQWEESSLEAEEFGVRTVLCRFGIILDREGGALPRMALPYKLFGGGTVGSGRQWVSWIHLDDAVEAIIFAIHTSTLEGAVNFTAPHPVVMKEFGKILGSVLGRPHWLPAPGFALKLALGEMSTLVLEGQKVIPQKLGSTGYPFIYPHLKPALENIYKS